MPLAAGQNNALVAELEALRAEVLAQRVLIEVRSLATFHFPLAFFLLLFCSVSRSGAAAALRFHGRGSEAPGGLREHGRLQHTGAALAALQRCQIWGESASCTSQVQELKNTQYSLGGAMDSAWLCLCGALVMFMHAGFAMLETGSCRAKNASNVLMKNLVNVTVAWRSSSWLLGL